MHTSTLRHAVRSLLVRSSAVVLILAASGSAAADPIRVTGTVFIDSAGGDFPDIPVPIDELIYSALAGPGLPEARGEVFETSALHGTHGGLIVTRPPSPEPLVAGSSYNLSSRATFTKGQAIEATFPESGRVYDIAGDFRFTAGDALLRPIEGLLIGSAPFTFSARLQGFAKTTGALLFDDELRGAGRATVHLSPQNPGFFDYRYDLQPTPEPATMVMLATGIGFVGLLRRRRATA
jgi:hypothetical protein